MDLEDGVGDVEHVVARVHDGAATADGLGIGRALDGGLAKLDVSIVYGARDVNG